jgi:hypothetical protein
LQIAGIAFFVWLGLEVHMKGIALLVGVIGSAVVAWRYSLSRRYATFPIATTRSCCGCSMSSKAMPRWPESCGASAPIWIYPSLSATTATAFVVTICGSVAIAAFFMSLVGQDRSQF